MPNSDALISAMPRPRFIRNSVLSAASFAAPWSSPVLPSDSLAALPKAAVWKLSIKDGRTTNCQLSFAREGPIRPGVFCVGADSHHDNATWHSLIFVPAGLLNTGQDFVGHAELRDHRALRQFIFTLRTRPLEPAGPRPDRWQTRSDETREREVAKQRGFHTSLHDSAEDEGRIFPRLCAEVGDCPSFAPISLPRQFHGSDADPPRLHPGAREP
jgi:hypothetical protein